VERPLRQTPMTDNANPLTPGTLAEFEAAMKGSSVKIVPMKDRQTVEF
jgi:hypothetical protein